MSAPQLLAFAGSTRRESFNKRLLPILSRGAERAGAQVTMVDLRDYAMPLYDGDLEAEQGVPAPALELRGLLKSSSGLLLACPEYNSSISGVLKNTIDWVSRPVQGEDGLASLRGKAVGLVSASPGALGGLRGLVHVRAILGNLGCLVVPQQVAVGGAGKAFGESGELRDQDMAARVEGVAEAVADLAARLGR